MFRLLQLTIIALFLSGCVGTMDIPYAIEGEILDEYGRPMKGCTFILKESKIFSKDLLIVEEKINSPFVIEFTSWLHSGDLSVDIDCGNDYYRYSTEKLPLIEKIGSDGVYNMGNILIIRR